MKLSISTLFAGALFGAGLTISGMVNPKKVISFLDVTGNWDPSLAFVMGAALLVTFIGYKLVLKNEAPLFDGYFRVPTRTDIDRPLLIGAVLFGVGWGMSGLCPGPAVAGFGFSGQNGLIFVASMIGAIIVYRTVKK